MKNKTPHVIACLMVSLCVFSTEVSAEKTIEQLISNYVKYYNARDFTSYMSLSFPVSENDVKPLENIFNRVKQGWSKPKKPIENYSFEVRELSNGEKKALANWYILPIIPTHLILIKYDPPEGGGASGHTLHAVQNDKSWYLQMPYIYPSNPNKKDNEADVTFKSGFSSGWPYSWKFNNLNYKSLEISLWKNNIKNRIIIESQDILAPGNMKASFSFDKAIISGYLNSPKNRNLSLPYAYWKSGKNTKGLSDWVKLEYGVFSNLNVYKAFEINSKGINIMASFSITHKDNTNTYEIRATYIK